MDKYVLITGASRGIGAKIAKKFAENGYNIYLNYKNNESLAEKLKKELMQNYNIIVKCIKFDVSCEEEVKENLSKIEKIDVLVNNAGISKDSKYTDKTKEEFISVLETNLIGTFLVTKYAVEKMDQGVIINIASNSGIDDYYPESMDYDASKAGVINLTHNFAKLLSPNIRVNAVAPGWVKTDMTEEINPKFYETIIDNCLLKRFATCEEIANVVYFLASEDASFINDAIIKVDGGRK